MSTQNFTYSFTTSKPVHEVFKILMTPRKWWTGLYNEIITGSSEKVDDEFIFTAGDGAHHSVQKLIEVIPNEKIVWEVINSNLTFLKETNEWAGTKITFEISTSDNKTNVVFIHDGLVPEFECYGGCSSAWLQYLENLEKALN
ncbi:ATPase [Chryseobacterium sp. IHB B 17019]|jgi:uncharacterized protein YndB with AHSA1/START domain|uniref:SRPBCC family protein n=1 Tax=Chryseobacterium sp. IHB B 17019 TaxID=1721091 RepID=UPI00071FED86|nr:SRPBCC domain-containing protein [Chryseobacterium sp. IHB B 17019]ALR29996.1 ATPase [Chryseobacterium sp. IHB B 17019]